TSIKASPGLIVRFYDRTIHDKIDQNIAQQRMTILALNHKKPCVVIDPGHGGNDRGAIGINNLQEKAICLSVSNKVVSRLRCSGCDALLTRATDCIVPLDDRSYYANSRQADLFVSIHANGATTPKACGIETFYGTIPNKQPLFSTLDGTDQKLLSAWTLNHEKESNALANTIQQSLCN